MASASGKHSRLIFLDDPFPDVGSVSVFLWVQEKSLIFSLSNLFFVVIRIRAMNSKLLHVVAETRVLIH